MYMARRPFTKDATMEVASSRHESLGLGNNSWYLSVFNDDGENKQTGISAHQADPSQGSCLHPAPSSPRQHIPWPLIPLQDTSTIQDLISRIHEKTALSSFLDDSRFASYDLQHITLANYTHY